MHNRHVAQPGAGNTGGSSNVLASSSSILLDEVTTAKGHDEEGRNNGHEHASQRRCLDECNDVGGNKVGERADADSDLLTRGCLDAGKVGVQSASNLPGCQVVEECKLLLQDGRKIGSPQTTDDTLRKHRPAGRMQPDKDKVGDGNVHNNEDLLVNRVLDAKLGSI